MAKATANEPAYTLELDANEAGYLYDLLYRHVGGELTRPAQPLGRIARALADAGVPENAERRAYNRNAEGPEHKHATLYVSRAQAHEFDFNEDHSD